MLDHMDISELQRPLLNNSHDLSHINKKHTRFLQIKSQTPLFSTTLCCAPLHSWVCFTSHCITLVTRSDFRWVSGLWLDFQPPALGNQHSGLCFCLNAQIQFEISISAAEKPGFCDTVQSSVFQCAGPNLKIGRLAAGIAGRSSSAYLQVLVIQLFNIFN